MDWWPYSDIVRCHVPNFAYHVLDLGLSGPTMSLIAEVDNGFPRLSVFALLKIGNSGGDLLEDRF